MNRVVAVTWAVAIAGAGLAWGQSGNPGSVRVTGDAAPPPSVIRIGPNNRPAFGNKPAKPATEAQSPKQLPADAPIEPDINAKEPAADVAPPQPSKPAPRAASPYLSDAPLRPSMFQQVSQSTQPTSPITTPGPQTPAPVPPIMTLPTPAKEDAKPEGPSVVKPREESPATTPVELPPPQRMPSVADAIAPVNHSHSYPTHLIGSKFPWTKCGKRVCGALYLDTPYVWLNTEYLVGWVKNDHTQTLITSGPADAPMPGALGEDNPTTTILYNGQKLQEQPFSGGRFTAGCWFDECQYCGAEGGFFFFGQNDYGFITGADGRPGLPGIYQPFFNPLTGAEDTFVVAQGGTLPASGVIEILSRTRVLGAEGHGIFSFSRSMNWRIDAICGVRWLGLDESITMNTSVKQYDQTEFNGANFDSVATDVIIFDRFTTRTDFVGADLGFKAHFEKQCWSLDVTTRVAIGGNHLRIRNEGQTTIGNVASINPDGNVALNVLTQGGRFVGPANNGEYTNDIFSVVPEVGFTLGYRPKHWCRLTLGYTWLFWTDVVRPGAQIDRVVNPAGSPTRPEFFEQAIYEPRRPGVAFNMTDIWLQSVTLGVQFMY